MSQTRQWLKKFDQHSHCDRHCWLVIKTALHCRYRRISGINDDPDKGQSDDIEDEFTCLAAVGDTIDKVKVKLIWNGQHSSQKRLVAYKMCRSDSVNYAATLYVLRNAWR
jgi:hypothetical protein